MRSCSWPVVIALGGMAPLALGCGGAPPPPVLRPLEVTIEEIGPEAPADDEDALDTTEGALLARTVAERREGSHGPLPAPVRADGSSPEAWPRIRVLNDTPYGIVVWVSGPCAREIVLPARGEHIADVCEGAYELAAQVAASGFTPLVGDGTELENGFTYTFTFFVVAERGGPSRTRAPRRR